MAPKWSHKNPLARLIDVVRFSDRHDPNNEKAKLRWRPLGHHIKSLSLLLFAHVAAALTLLLLALLSPWANRVQGFPLYSITSRQSSTRLDVGLLASCYSSANRDPVCSSVGYTANRAYFHSAVTNSALRSTMPSAYRTQAILITTGLAGVIVVLLLIVSSIWLEHRLRKDLSSTIPLRTLQKRQTRARHLAMRVAQLTVIVGALGLTGAVQARTSVERTYIGFLWVLANSNEAAAGTLNRIEVGRGFTILWAAFAILASLMVFIIVLISTEADVIVEETPSAVSALTPSRTELKPTVSQRGSFHYAPTMPQRVSRAVTAPMRRRMPTVRWPSRMRPLGDLFKSKPRETVLNP